MNSSSRLTHSIISLWSQTTGVSVLIASSFVCHVATCGLVASWDHADPNKQLLAATSFIPHAPRCRHRDLLPRWTWPLYLTVAATYILRDYKCWLFFFFLLITLHPPSCVLRTVIKWKLKSLIRTILKGIRSHGDTHITSICVAVSDIYPGTAKCAVNLMQGFYNKTKQKKEKKKKEEKRKKLQRSVCFHCSALCWEAAFGSVHSKPCQQGDATDMWVEG